MLSYFVTVKPFESKLENAMEMFNETCVFIFSLQLYAFTDYLNDPEM
jgi:hypothetical protein